MSNKSDLIIFNGCVFKLSQIEFVSAVQRDGILHFGADGYTFRIGMQSGREERVFRVNEEIHNLRFDLIAELEDFQEGPIE